ncbi:MAG: hypothetical protein SNH73_01750 [Rikenellaceae bacterium]
MKQLLLILSVTIFLSASCASHRLLDSSQKDSVRIEVIHRDVIIHDTVIVKIPEIKEQRVVMCDSSLLSNEYSLSQAKILSSGELFHTLSTIPQEIYQPMISQVEVQDSIIYHERVISKVVEVPRELSSWQSFQIKSFYLLLAILIVLLFLWR